MSQHLALVIGGTAGPDPSVTDFGLERIAGPEVQRVHRLHVVMAVDEHGAPIRQMGVAGDDHRVFRSFVEFCCEAEICEFGEQPIGTSTHIIRVPRIRGNTRETEKGKEIFNGLSHGTMLAA